MPWNCIEVRIWDIDPGFLNNRSLLGEHLELHGIFNIITLGKKGYSRHPETLRWRHHLHGLVIRHGLQVQEMGLRGFHHRSPLPFTPAVPFADTDWPPVSLDLPGCQYGLLREKYRAKEPGRIPLPRNTQELWARHKYSTMARSYQEYKRIGSAVAQGEIDFDELSGRLVTILRNRPPAKPMINTVMHMWGYVSNLSENSFQPAEIHHRFREIQKKAAEHSIDYLLHSTALSELAFWLPAIPAE